MNYTTAVFLINPNLRAIKVSYLPRPEKNDTFYASDEDPKNVKMYKTLDQNIKVGDLVVVPTNTRHGFTVCKVEEVDVPVDYDSGAEVKWIVDLVNTPKYDQIVKDEAEYIKEMRAAEETAKREELKAKLFKFSTEKLQALPIATTVIAKEA